MTAISEAVVSTVANVPPQLVVRGNIWSALGDDPHAGLTAVFAGRPVIFLETHHHPGVAPHGVWAVGGADLARQVFMDTETFTTAGTTALTHILGEMYFIPLEADPPEHAGYRGIINDYFKPASVRQLAGRVAERSEFLLARVRDNGRCEFVGEFGKLLPAAIFLDLYGLPFAQADQFLDWATVAISSPSIDARRSAMQNIRDLLAREVEHRRASPQDDILSRYAHATFDGRPLTRGETLGGLMLLFLGGLDTVASLLGWVIRDLARNPDRQEFIRNNPGKRNGIIEEMLRFYSSVTITRRATRDIVLGEATIRAGDTVSCMTTVMSRDPDEFADPDELNLTRGSSRHLAFGYGPHSCIGMHLARLEIGIALEHWLERMPPFRIDERQAIVGHGGGILALDALPLRWD